MGEDCPHCVFEKTEANCRGCFEGSHYKPKPITNADRIRSMMDEELADKFEEIQLKTIKAYSNDDLLLKGELKKYWLNWLKKENKRND